MFGKDSGFVFADIYSKKFQKKMAVNIPGQFVGSRFWWGLFKVGNIFVFLRLFSFLKGYYLSLIGSERHTPPPGATDEDGGWVWAIAPPIYLTLCFIL